MFCISIVEYATYDDMKNAMRKLNGAELNGRKLRLVEDYRGGRKRRYSSCTEGLVSVTMSFFFFFLNL